MKDFFSKYPWRKFIVGATLLSLYFGIVCSVLYFYCAPKLLQPEFKFGKIDVSFNALFGVFLNSFSYLFKCFGLAAVVMSFMGKINSGWEKQDSWVRNFLSCFVASIIVITTITIICLSPVLRLQGDPINLIGPVITLCAISMPAAIVGMIFGSIIGLDKFCVKR